MSDPIFKINVAEWVESAKADPVAYRQRQTVEIILNAIAMTAPLNAKMFLKGGILMGLAYDSPRQTTDIDLTTKLEVEGAVGDKIRKLLDSAFAPRRRRARLYRPRRQNPFGKTPTREDLQKRGFPRLEAQKSPVRQRGAEQEKALQEGKAPGVINVDISFKEPMQQIQVLELTGGQKLYAYGLVDLIAEKYRAILQQVPRKRNRRQDVYDLDLLIARNEIDVVLQAQILDAFVVKCRARHLNPIRFIPRRSGDQSAR